jgi:hypothetical protein
MGVNGRGAEGIRRDAMSTIHLVFICFFGILMVGAVIVALLRLLVVALPLFSVIGLVVLLAIDLGTQPVLVLVAGFCFLLIVLRMFKGRAWLHQPQPREDSSRESRAEPARNLKTRRVFWWLAPDHGRTPQLMKAPRGLHSAKPAAFAEMIEQLFPTVPKLEMFARQVRAGWDAWGAKVDDPCHRSPAALD